MEDQVKALADKAVKAPKSQDALRFAQAASVLQEIARTKMFMKLDEQNMGGVATVEVQSEAGNAETE